MDEALGAARQAGLALAGIAQFSGWTPTFYPFYRVVRAAWNALSTTSTIKSPAAPVGSFSGS